MFCPYASGAIEPTASTAASVAIRTGPVYRIAGNARLRYCTDNLQGGGTGRLSERRPMETMSLPNPQFVWLPAPARWRYSCSAARPSRQTPRRPLVGRPAFLQGSYPGCDLSERPVCASKRRFRGVAPTRRDSRTHCTGVQPGSLASCPTRLRH